MRIVSAFVEAGFLEVGRLRVWAMTAPKPDWFLLVTDDTHDANTALLRQLRCALVIHSTVRLPGVLRSAGELALAHERRDRAMLAISEHAYVFGSIEVAGIGELEATKVTFVR